MLAPQSGVLLNDELTDFTDPETAARFGAAPGPNAPRGGARPASSMTPTIVFKDGAPEIAAAGSGGSRIPVNLAQVLLCRLVFNKALDACVAAPRFFVPATGPMLSYNAEQLPPLAVQLDLIERGEQLKLMTGDDVSAIQIVMLDRAGRRRASHVRRRRSAQGRRRPGALKFRPFTWAAPRSSGCRVRRISRGARPTRPRSRR